MDKSARGKIICTDTSTIVHDPHAILRFEENEVRLDAVSVQELEALKTKKYGAREAIRVLDELKRRTRDAGLEIKDGMPTPGGGRVFFHNYKPQWDLAPNFERTNDLRIVLAALSMQKNTKECNGREVVLVSKDIAQRLTAEILGVRAEDYKHDRTFENYGDVYTGHRQIVLPNGDVGNIFGLLPRENFVSLSAAQESVEDSIEDLHPNECVTFVRSDESRACAIYDAGAERFVRVPFKYSDLESYNDGRKKGIRPKTEEQGFAHTLLTNDNISLVTLMGVAGCGKTLMALNAGIEQMSGSNQKFERIVVFRPMETVGESMGYLPGSVAEKYEPWTEAVRDQLEVIFQHDIRPDYDHDKQGTRGDMLLTSKKIVCSPITFTRGRTLRNTFIIIDEAQNLTPLEAKTLGTRAGTGSKLVFTGDPEQIDTRNLDILSNGLVHAVGRSMGAAHYGHIRMRRSVRSELAQFVADRF